jgi:Protein of unknown function (DUF3224)
MVRDAYRMISGTLTVRDIGPHESISVPNGRHVLEEEYHGGLRSRATGEMLTSGESKTGEETYVAIKSFDGTLNDRRAGFALAHFGQMHGASEELRISITPGSGTGKLSGIWGTAHPARGRWRLRGRYLCRSPDCID